MAQVRPVVFNVDSNLIEPTIRNYELKRILNAEAAMDAAVITVILSESSARRGEKSARLCSRIYSGHNYGNLKHSRILTAR